MKYENFDKCKEIKERIDELRDKLKQLSNQPPIVRIQSHSGFLIYTIGTENTCEHPYQEPASELVEKIKDDVFKRIEKLIAELEKL